MKEVDWSKAPEGTTHYNEYCPYPWLKETPASYYCDGVWIEYDSPDEATEHIKNAAKRPQEWDGGGVPPVGAVCEYYWSKGDKWLKCEVVAHYYENVVAVDVTDSDAVCLPTHRFRPIKTLKQIAKEERQQAIDEMVDFAAPCITYRDLMGLLYDAGYRKTEVKK